MQYNMALDPQYFVDERARLAWLAMLETESAFHASRRAFLALFDLTEADIVETDDGTA
jgi:hypothetical protein